MAELEGPPRPTCFPAAARRPSRLDRILLNAGALAMFAGFEVLPALGIPTHCGLALTLRVGPPPLYPHRVPAARLVADPVPAWDDARCLRGLEARYLAEARARLQADDIDGVWRLVCEAAEEYLVARRGGGPRGARLPGVRAGPRPAFAVDADGVGGTVDRRLAALLRRERQLRALRRLWPAGVGALPLRAAQLVAALRCQAVSGPAACPEWLRALDALRTGDGVALLAVRAREELAAARGARAAERRDHWHAWCVTDVRQGGRRLFRWLRQGRDPGLCPAVQVDGEWRGGPGAQLDRATAAWQPLWTRADSPHPEEAAWLRHLALLPPFPSPPPLSVDECRLAFAALPTGRAPGLDGWDGAELRLWPRPLVDITCGLLRAIERLGRWPQGLLRAEVVLLPKPGGDPGDPLQRRPITLLPVLYRLWARLRWPVVQAWRAASDPAVATASLGADGHAWQLGLDLALGRCTGHTVSGVAVDFAKCYDGVRLALLARARWAPPAGRLPFSALLCRPTRRRGGSVLGRRWARPGRPPAGGQPGAPWRLGSSPSSLGPGMRRSAWPARTCAFGPMWTTSRPGAAARVPTRCATPYRSGW